MIFVFEIIQLIFWRQELTLKVQFWRILMNRNSLTDLKKKSFEFADSWSKILLFLGPTIYKTPQPN